MRLALIPIGLVLGLAAHAALPCDLNGYRFTYTEAARRGIPCDAGVPGVTFKPRLRFEPGDCIHAAYDLDGGWRCLLVWDGGR